MVKKGKFKLLSYLIDESLIYYKSLNRNKKIIGFSIFEIDDINSIVPILNRFLKKRILNYYSIQINIIESMKKIILLNFEDYEKNRILKIFNLICEKFARKNLNIKFLKNQYLENSFLKVITNDLDLKINVLKSSESLLINNHTNLMALSFYSINFDNLGNKRNFMYDFLNFIKNFNRDGYLILNFKLNSNDNIVISSYFVEKRRNNENLINMESEINNFFNCTLIEKLNVSIEAIFRLLWRFEISNKYFLLNEISELFLKDSQYNLRSISKINLQFEHKLLKNQINFNRLNKNLLLIEQHSLFLIFLHINFKLILELIKKHYPKYHIYILSLNEREYHKLLKIDKIKLLKNIKIVDPKEFQSFNVEIFKKNLFLENR